MTKIKLYCRGAMAKAKVEGQLTHAMVGIPVSVEWDGEWEGLRKVLKVRCGQTCRSVRLEGTEAYLPWECLIAGQRLECGVDGWDMEGKLRLPTNWASCGMVKPSVAEQEGLEAAQPTLEFLEALLVRVKAELQQQRQQFEMDSVRLHDLEALLKEIEDRIHGGAEVDTATISQINELIVAYFEEKTVSEVEA